MDETAGVTFYLHIPFSKQSEIQSQYSSITQHRQEYCRYWLTYHPSPSWLVVANALYMTDEHGALEVLQKFYLKGEHKHTVHEPEWGLMWTLIIIIASTVCYFNLPCIIHDNFDLRDP